MAGEGALILQGFLSGSQGIAKGIKQRGQNELIQQQLELQKQKQKQDSELLDLRIRTAEAGLVEQEFERDQRNKAITAKRSILQAISAGARSTPDLIESFTKLSAQPVEPTEQLSFNQPVDKTLQGIALSGQLGEETTQAPGGILESFLQAGPEAPAVQTSAATDIPQDILDAADFLRTTKPQRRGGKIQTQRNELQSDIDEFIKKTASEKFPLPSTGSRGARGGQQQALSEARENRKSLENTLRGQLAGDLPVETSLAQAPQQVQPAAEAPVDPLAQFTAPGGEPAIEFPEGTGQEIIEEKGQNVIPGETPINDPAFLSSILSQVKDAELLSNQDFDQFQQTVDQIRFSDSNTNKISLGLQQQQATLNKTLIDSEKTYADIAKLNREASFSGKKLSEAQAKIKGYAQNMEDFREEMERIEGLGYNPGALLAGLNPLGGNVGPVWLQGEERQSWNAAASGWVKLILRHHSGAAVPPEENVDYIRTFLPVPGDEPGTVALKKRMMRQLEQGMVDILNEQGIGIDEKRIRFRAAANAIGSQAGIAPFSESAGDSAVGQEVDGFTIEQIQ